jgi:hypothetical protein
MDSYNDQKKATIKLSSKDDDMEVERRRMPGCWQRSHNFAIPSSNKEEFPPGHRHVGDK